MGLSAREKKKLGVLIAKTNDPLMKARYLDPKVGFPTDPTPKRWFRNWIVSDKAKPPESGFAYVQTPYADLYTKLWGVATIADLPKYRLMYRTVPVIKRAVDKSVLVAVSKGFDLKPVDDSAEAKRAVEVVDEWLLTQRNIKEFLGSIASDMLVYGNAFAEIVHEKMDIEKATSEELSRYEIVKEPSPFNLTPKSSSTDTPTIVQSVDNAGGFYNLVKPRGKPVWLKPLDPLTMRVRRDSFGNVYGYLQLLGVPPTAFTTENMAFFKHLPKTWQYESAYGVSSLMSVIRTQDIIWQLENDLLIISHAAKKVPSVFKGGSAERGYYSQKQLDVLSRELAERDAASDIFVRGDVEVEPLPLPASSIQPILNYLKYHHDQRTTALGVPPVLMGIPDGTTQTTATVSFEDFIDNIRSLQETIADTLETQVFSKVLAASGLDKKWVPEVEWRSVGKRDETSLANMIVALFNSRLITANEARALLRQNGLRFEDVDGGDELGPSMGPQEDFGDKQTQRKPKDSALGGSTAKKMPRLAEEEAENLEAGVETTRKAQYRPYNGVLNRAEASVARKILKAYRFALDEIGEIGAYVVDSQKTQAPIAIDDRLSKEQIGKMLGDAAERVYIYDEFESVLAAGVALADRQVRIDPKETTMRRLVAANEPQTDRLDPNEVNRYANSTVAQIKDSSTAIRDGVYDKLQTALKEGWGGERFSRELRTEFGFAESKARLIANTELIRSYRAKFLEVVKENANEVGLTAQLFQWRISPDELVCHECIALAGQGPMPEEEILDANEEIHPNCRCWWSAIF